MINEAYKQIVSFRKGKKSNRSKIEQTEKNSNYEKTESQIDFDDMKRKMMRLSSMLCPNPEI